MGQSQRRPPGPATIIRTAGIDLPVLDRLAEMLLEAVQRGAEEPGIPTMGDPGRRRRAHLLELVCDAKLQGVLVVDERHARKGVALIGKAEEPERLVELALLRHIGRAGRAEGLDLVEDRPQPRRISPCRTPGGGRGLDLPRFFAATQARFFLRIGNQDAGWLGQDRQTEPAQDSIELRFHPARLDRAVALVEPDEVDLRARERERGRLGVGSVAGHTAYRLPGAARVGRTPVILFLVAVLRVDYAAYTVSPAISIADTLVLPRWSPRI
jgi:hypothetical protein